MSEGESSIHAEADLAEAAAGEEARESGEDISDLITNESSLQEEEIKPELAEDDYGNGRLYLIFNPETQEVLLEKRTDKSNRGKYSGPGETRKKGETGKKTEERGIEEEIGPEEVARIMKKHVSSSDFMKYEYTENGKTYITNISAIEVTGKDWDIIKRKARANVGDFKAGNDGGRLKVFRLEDVLKWNDSEFAFNFNDHLRSIYTMLNSDKSITKDLYAQFRKPNAIENKKEVNIIYSNMIFN